jgi:maleylacetate reductase
MIAIPTTLSGAEFTPFATVLDERIGVQDTFRHPDLAPDAVILDPKATMDTPGALWASTGLRALARAIETWCARFPSPYSDATSLYAFRELTRWLPESATRPGQPDARLACQVASWMAIQGAAVGIARGPGGRLGHALSAAAGVGDGVALGILLPHALRYAGAASRERQEALTQGIGRPGEPLADIVAEIVAKLRLPAKLRDVGVQRSRLSAVAKAASADPLTRADAREFEGGAAPLTILEAAF